MISLEAVIMILTMVGSVLAIYLNFRKVGDNIKQDTAWRTKVDSRLDTIASDVKEIKESEKGIVASVKALEKDVLHLSGRIDIVENEAKGLWHNVKELKGNKGKR